MRPLARLGVPAGLLLTALLTGCAAEPVTTQGRKIESLYYVTLALAIVIFCAVVGLVLYSVVRFRRQPGDDTLPPQVHGNTTAEVIWTAIPIAIVLVLFGMSYSTLRAVDKKSPDDQVAAVIHVRGYQWFWEFDYGDGKVAKQGNDGKAPTMVVPVGETIRVVMTSDNVNHAWYVPNFLFKKDVIAGKPNTFEFKVEVNGRYKGQCAELCGTRHADMVFDVAAVTRAEFDKFIAEFPVGGCEDTDKPATAHELASPRGQVAFDKDCLVVPPQTPFTVKYTHQGGLGQPHNVAVRGAGNPAPLYSGDLIDDDQSITYDVPGFPAGSYEFFCVVHPGMKGQLLVKEGA